MDKVNMGQGADREDRGREITIDEESWTPNREFEVGLCLPSSPFSLAS